MRRFTLLLVAMLLLEAVLAAATPAQPTTQVNCRMTGTASQVEIAPGFYRWELDMVGRCAHGSLPRHYASLSAEGTSSGLGLCGGSILVSNLSLDVVLFIYGNRYESLILEERWYAEITTFPVATPFVIYDRSSSFPQERGAGVLFQHLALNCAGSPATTTFNIRLT